MSTFVETEKDSAVRICTMPLLGIWEDGAIAQGTAVMVGPGLALTAAHVVDDFYQRRTGKKMPQEDGAHTMPMPCVLVCQQMVAGPPVSWFAWRVARVWMSPLSDIALLGLAPADANEKPPVALTVPRIQIRPPAAGQHVVACGFHDARATMTEPRKVQWNDTFSTATGLVTEVHPQQRDAARLKFPCFETDMRVEGGMSGGPVFNDAGELCGLVCDSLPTNEPGEREVSWHVLLWPMLATIIDAGRPNNSTPPGTPYPALELARDGTIFCDGHELVAFEWDGITRVTISLPQVR